MTCSHALTQWTSCCRIWASMREGQTQNISRFVCIVFIWQVHHAKFKQKWKFWIIKHHSSQYQWPHCKYSTFQASSYEVDLGMFYRWKGPISQYICQSHPMWGGREGIDIYIQSLSQWSASKLQNSFKNSLVSSIMIIQNESIFALLRLQLPKKEQIAKRKPWSAWSLETFQVAMHYIARNKIWKME